MLRLALRRSLDPQKELTYRIFLQEVPSAPKPGFRGLQVALRMSIPVFAKSNQALLPKTQWKLTSIAKDHTLRVEAINLGTAHIHLYEFALRNPKSDANLTLQQTAVYLLPGQRHEWLLKIDDSMHIDSAKQDIDLDQP
jgi:fimbrial chaperone protein